MVNLRNHDGETASSNSCDPANPQGRAGDSPPYQLGFVPVPPQSQTPHNRRSEPSAPQNEASHSVANPRRRVPSAPRHRQSFSRGAANSPRPAHAAGSHAASHRSNAVPQGGPASALAAAQALLRHPPVAVGGNKPEARWLRDVANLVGQARQLAPQPSVVGQPEPQNGGVERQQQ